MSANKKRPVLGIDAPPAKPTVLGAALIAAGIALPAGILIWVIDWLI